MKKLIPPIFIFLFSVLVFSILTSPASAQEEDQCRQRYSVRSHEARLAWVNCGYECTNAYPRHVADKEGRTACVSGCDVIRDEEVAAAAAEREKCYAAQDAATGQSEADTTEEDTVADDVSESEPVPNKPGFGGVQETFQWINGIVKETTYGLVGVTVLFSGPASWEEAGLLLETIFPTSRGEQVKSLTPINLNEKPPEYIVEVTIEPVVVKSGPALIEIKSYNGEAGILKNGDMPLLEQGAVDVFVEPGSSEGFQIQTPDADFFVVLTKFSIIHDKKNFRTLLAVYEGEVEVKTREGQTVKVSPNGDEPGLLVVSRKLSVPKLSTLAAVTVAIAGAIVWFVKRKKKR